MIFASCFLVNPRVRSALRSRSTVTAGSGQNSILATRDWLADHLCQLDLCHLLLEALGFPRLPLSTNSTQCNGPLRRSAGGNRQAVLYPTTQPLASSFFFFLLSISGLASGVGVVSHHSLAAECNCRLWRRLGLLLEDLENQHCVGVDPVENPPNRRSVGYSQFVAPQPNRGAVGRECGSDNAWPACGVATNGRPPGELACSKGGDLTSPPSHTSGLSVGFMEREYAQTDILSRAKKRRPGVWGKWRRWPA